MFWVGLSKKTKIEERCKLKPAWAYSQEYGQTPVQWAFSLWFAPAMCERVYMLYKLNMLSKVALYKYQEKVFFIPCRTSIFLYYYFLISMGAFWASIFFFSTQASFWEYEYIISRSKTWFHIYPLQIWSESHSNLSLKIIFYHANYMPFSNRRFSQKGGSWLVLGISEMWRLTLFP